MEGTHEVGRRPFMPDSTLSRRSAALMGAWTRPPLLPKTHKFHTETAGEPKKRFERCKTQILALEWVTQGSLSQSPQGNWRWTRKLKAKTVTVALSDKQAELFRLAIDGHRELENLIDQMRAISQQVLLDSVEGPPRRKRRISS